MERLFDIQLEKLRKKIIKMCSLVAEQVDSAIRSIEEENIQFAETVIENDKKVDKYDVKIEKICQKMFALNQPVALDLRMIMTALTINTNLERIGDLAVNVAENLISMKKKPSFINRTHFDEMAKTTREMLSNSIDAIIQNDAGLAQKVIQTDNVLDQLNLENRNILIDIMKESPENIEQGVSLLVVSRQFERIGDHATNIAEDVYFIVEAQLIKHKYEKYLFGDTDEDEDENENEEKS